MNTRRSILTPILDRVSLHDRIAIQVRVISALMIRNIVSKYGRDNIGFLWLVAEPASLVTGVILLWRLMHGEEQHGVSIVTFTLTGYVPLTLYRHLSQLARLMSGNYGLLYHRQITVFDILIARGLTELAGVSAAGIIVYFALLSLNLIDWVADPSLVLVGLLLMFWFSLAFGCLIAGLSEKSEILETLIQPIQYLMLPVSGVFYMVSWLPLSLQKYALYVPLPHMYEMIRSGFLGSQMEAHFSISYVVLWCLSLSALGIWSMVSSRKTLSFR